MHREDGCCTAAQEDVCEISCSLGNHPGCLYRRFFILMGQGVDIEFHSAVQVLHGIKAFRMLSCIPRVLKPWVGDAREWSMNRFQGFLSSWNS